MKLYTVAGGSAIPGWKITRTGGRPAIVLGEEGRGRTLTRCPLTEDVSPILPRRPCPSGPEPIIEDYKTCMHCHSDQPGPHNNLPEKPAEWLTNATLMRPAGAAHVLQVQPTNGTDNHSPSRSCAVLVRDHSGFRGGWSLLGRRTGDCPGADAPALRVKGDAASAFDVDRYRQVARQADAVQQDDTEARLAHALAHWQSLPLPVLPASEKSVTNTRGETTKQVVQPWLEWQGSVLCYCEPHPRTGDIRYRETAAQAEPRNYSSSAKLSLVSGRDHRISRYWPGVVNLMQEWAAGLPECPAYVPPPVPDDVPADLFSLSTTGYCACGKTVGGWDGLQYREPQGDAPWLPIVRRHGAYGETPRVLATGHCADGIAGRAGGGDEVILVLAPGDGFTISRSGRLYGAASLILVSWDGESLLVETLAQQDERTAASKPVEEIWR